MAVDVLINRCSCVAMGSTLFCLQVTIVAGPPEVMQVRVLDVKLYSIEDILGAPEQFCTMNKTWYYKLQSSNR